MSKEKTTKNRETKSLDERIEQVYALAEEHFGEIRFAGIKKHTKIGWVAKVRFDAFESLAAEGETAEDAVKNLRKRLKKIIDRYHMV